MEADRHPFGRRFALISLTADDTRLLKDVQLFIEPIEVYDPAGRLLGLFVPANLERGKEIQAKIAAQVDWAEIERRKNSKEPRVLHEEALAHLRLLEAELARRKAAGEEDWTTDEAMSYFQSLRPNGPVPNPPGELPAKRTETGKCDIP